MGFVQPFVIFLTLAKVDGGLQLQRHHTRREACAAAPVVIRVNRVARKVDEKMTDSEAREQFYWVDAQFVGCEDFEKEKKADGSKAKAPHKQ